MEPVKLGVIGAGYWGKKVIKEAQTISEEEGTLNLQYVVDNSPTALEQCARKFGPLDYRIGYESLLSDPELSAVHICTPNGQHFRVASAFLKAGKNVLLEKPLTLKSEEAYQLVQLAEDNNVVLCVGHIHRFNNGIRELKRALATGVLGTPYYLRLEWTGYLPPQTERDVLTDLAPHPLDICNYLTGKWPDNISCRAKGYRTTENEEVAFMSCEYEDGVYAHIEVSWLDRQKRRTLAFVAKEGIATLDCLEQTATVQHKDKIEPVPIVPSNTLREEITHFVDCVGRNLRSESYSNDSDGLLGAHVVTCLEAAKESLSLGHTVKVKFPLAKEVELGRQTSFQAP